MLIQSIRHKIKMGEFLQFYKRANTFRCDKIVGDIKISEMREILEIYQRFIRDIVFTT